MSSYTRVTVPALTTLAVMFLAFTSSAFAQKPRPGAELQDQSVAIATERVTQNTRSAVINADLIRSIHGSNAKLTRYDAGTGRAESVTFSDLSTTPQQYIAVNDPGISANSLTVNGRKLDILPVRIFRTKADGTQQSLVVTSHSQGLFWQPESQSFLADLILSVLDENNPSDTSNLNPKVPVHLTGRPGSIGQTEFLFDRLGDWSKRTPVTTDVGGDSFPVTILTPIAPNGTLAKDIPFVKPRLKLQASPEEIDGLGLQSTHISLQVAEEANAIGPDLSFKLTYTGGQPSHDTLITNDSGKTYYTDFWSTGIGEESLSIDDPRFDISEVVVTTLIPYGFLAAVILGALLGATALVFWRRWKDPNGAYLWSWLASSVFSVGIVIAVYAGFHLPQIPELPELLRNASITPFGLAFIVAFFITTIVSGFNKKQDQD